MFEIGDSLREARTRRGLSAADVHKGIRIRERYLSALEEERWEVLPGEAYTKGFLRTYAEFLGLDGSLYIDEYNSRIAHRDEEPALVPESLTISHRARRGVIRALIGAVVLGVLVAALAAWDMSKPAGGSGTPATGLGVNAAAAQTPAAATKPAAPARTARTKQVATPVATATATVITASRGRSWLSIRAGGPNGAIVFQGVLEQGKALHYTLKQRLWVRLGRPTNIDIRLGGHLVSGLPARPSNVLLTRSGPQAA